MVLKVKIGFPQSLWKRLTPNQTAPMDWTWPKFLFLKRVAATTLSHYLRVIFTVLVHTHTSTGPSTCIRAAIAFFSHLSLFLFVLPCLCCWLSLTSKLSQWFNNNLSIPLTSPHTERNVHTFTLSVASEHLYTREPPPLPFQPTTHILSGIMHSWSLSQL